MESIKNVDDFKKFLEANRERFYAIAENADDISVDDEWMQENQWDELYRQKENQYGEV